MAIEHGFLYEQIAEDLAGGIRQGVYMVGERMPSLRRVSEQYNVSMATAIQAFQLLEQQDLVQARPKSGYFVNPAPVRAHSIPMPSNPSPKPTNVSVGRLALSLVGESKSPNLIKLGAAVPGPEMQPLRALARDMAGAARRRWQENANYAAATGTKELRQQIARIMRQAGCACAPEDIIVTNGCLEALLLALRVVAKPGDIVAIESPTYFGVLQVIEAMGVKAVEVATHSVTGIDLQALRQTIHKHSIKACILMPSFNNPLGSLMPDPYKQQVVELLRDAGIPLIEDDVYGALSFKQPRPKCAKAFDTNGNVLYCSSFSKTIAPGIRIGWIAPGKFQEQVEYHKFLQNISTATLSQLALAEFLAKGNYGRNIRKNVRDYRLRMEEFKRWIEEYFPEHTRVTQPQGGMVLWLELPPQIDCVELYKKALEKRIAISPGVLFSAHNHFRHHVRISCGAVEGKKAQTALRQLGAIAKSML